MCALSVGVSGVQREQSHRLKCPVEEALVGKRQKARVCPNRWGPELGKKEKKKQEIC